MLDQTLFVLPKKLHLSGQGERAKLTNGDINGSKEYGVDTD